MSVCHIGDCREVMRRLVSEGVKVQMCVTSPPYWGLRDYGHPGQLGLESAPQEYVANMVEVFRLVRELLADDGTLWLNLGDSYAGGGNYRGVNSEETLSAKQRSNGGARGVSQLLGSAGKEYGLAPKNLVGIPWRVAFALQSDGWYLRQDIIWAKPNPMPESVTDRCTKAHEYIFLLSKSARYYYDAEAIAEDFASEPGPLRDRRNEDYGEAFLTPLGKGLRSGYEKGRRNKRSVWTVTTKGYPDAHFATFPPDLIEPCILAGSKPGDAVLDPFFGSGTTGEVAQNLGRKWIGCELNDEYRKLQDTRTAQQGLTL